MIDIVEKLLLRENISSRKIFQEAYKTSPYPDNWAWAHSIWTQSGIITATVKTYCEAKLNQQLPPDTPDHAEELR